MENRVGTVNESPPKKLSFNVRMDGARFQDLFAYASCASKRPSRTGRTSSRRIGSGTETESGKACLEEFSGFIKSERHIVFFSRAEVAEVVMEKTRGVIVAAIAAQVISSKKCLARA
jgi:hypothetical protein